MYDSGLAFSTVTSLEKSSSVSSAYFLIKIMRYLSKILLLQFCLVSATNAYDVKKFETKKSAISNEVCSGYLQLWLRGGRTYR